MADARIMKPVCSECGRRTTPFAFSEGKPVGPTCARKLGIPGAATKSADGITRKGARRGAVVTDKHTIDLFPETL